MAAEVPTFKLVLVGDGGTGKVSNYNSAENGDNRWIEIDLYFVWSLVLILNYNGKRKSKDTNNSIRPLSSRDI